MNLISIKPIKELLEKYRVKPSKGLGQNFLVHQGTLNAIIEAAELSPKDTVLEVGPGIGTLTQELAKKAGQVIAVEKDSHMVEILKETLKDYSNVEVIQGDSLQYEELPKHYKVVANIPYYLTSPLIRKFLESDNKPEYMVLMVQKEVAKRICANPPDMSLLAVSVQFYADAKMIAKVPREYFWPSPNVDSAIIKIVPKKESFTVDPTIFFKVVKAGFSQPRKQLGNNLSKSLKKDREVINKWLVQNRIDPQQRAETLNIKDWITLAKTF